MKGKEKEAEESTDSIHGPFCPNKKHANLLRAFLAWLSGGDGEGVRLLLRRSRRPGGIGGGFTV